MAAIMAAAPPCHGVVSAAELETVGREDPSRPNYNRLAIGRQGSITWNGAAIDLIRLRQYLDITANMRPTPRLVTSAEPGADSAFVETVREVIYRSLSCRADSF